MTDVLSVLWRASWQGTLVLLGVWIVCRCAPRLPTSLPCLLWRLGQVKLLLALVPLAIALPLLAPPPAVLVAPQVEAAPLAEEEITQAPPVRVTSVSPSLTAPPADAAALAAPPLPSPTEQFAYAAALVYGLGVAVQGLLLWRGSRSVRRLRRAAVPLADAEISNLVRDLARSLRLRQVPTVLLSDAVHCPLATGIVRPTVLLPRSVWAAASLSERRLMLAHEMAHIRRGDLRWQIVTLAVQTVFFFHPFVWVARRQERLAREIACDALTLQITRETPARYGALLVQVAAGRPAALPALCVGAVEKGTLMKRLNRLGQTAPARRVGVLGGALLGTVALVALVPWRLTAQTPRGENVTSAPSATSDAESETVEGVVLLPDGKPAANARVRWVIEQYPRPNRIVAETRADAQGRYALTVANPPRHRYSRQNWLDGSIVAFAPDTAPGVTRIWANDAPLEVRLHSLARREAVFSDEAGRPIANLRVSVAALYYKSGTVHVTFPTVRTDSRGSVRFADLPRDGRVGWRVLDERWTPVAMKQVWTAKPPRARYTLTPARTLTGVAKYADGRPLAGAWVDAWRMDVNWQLGVPNGRGALTDAKGRYRISRLAAGRHRLHTPVNGKPYVIASAPDVVVGPTPVTTAPPLIVGEGVVVTGTVREKNSGKPLPGVWLAAGPEGAMQGVNARYVMTDANGRYRLRVPEGRARVSVQEGSQSDIGRAMPASGKFVARMGQESRQDFVIARKQESLYTGVVIDQNGKPVRQAQLDLISGWPNEFRTDARGRYRIRLTEQTPQDYPVVVRLGNIGGKTTITPGTEKTVQVTLTPQVPATIAGVVRSEANKPLANAKVRIYCKKGNTLSEPKETRTDATGRYRFRVSPLYQYVVEAQAAGYGLYRNWEQSIEPAGGEQTTIPDLTLLRAAKLARGQVVNENGVPVSYATVVVYGVQSYSSAKTDTQGRFTARNIVAGESLHVTISKGSSHWAHLPLSGAAEQKIVLRKADRNRPPSIAR